MSHKISIYNVNFVNGLFKQLFYLYIRNTPFIQIVVYNYGYL